MEQWGAQYLTELCLGAIRMERHLVHMPTHPTGVIRDCPFCDTNLTRDELIHVIILCPMAQYVWLNIEAALKTGTGVEVKLDLDMLFTAKQLDKGIPKARWMTIRSFAGEGLATIMGLYYKRESWLSGDNIYNIIRFRLRQNIAIRTGKMPTDEDMYRKKDVRDKLCCIKARFDMLGYMDKWDLNKANMTFHWQRAGGGVRGDNVRLCAPMEVEERDENTHHMRCVYTRLSASTDLNTKLMNGGCSIRKIAYLLGCLRRQT